LASRLCLLIVPEKRVQVGVVVQDHRIAPPAITAEQSLSVIHFNIDTQVFCNGLKIIIKLLLLVRDQQDCGLTMTIYPDLSRDQVHLDVYGLISLRIETDL
jgi:hypothetical protein